jgi:hypothetical protein
MPTTTLSQLNDKTLVLKHYNAEVQNFIFEVFDADITLDEQYLGYISDYEVQTDPASSVLISISQPAPENIIFVKFVVNDNFSKQLSEIYGFTYGADGGRDDRGTVLEDIIISGISDFIPPKKNRTLIYDFKFINDSVNHVFPNIELSRTMAIRGQARTLSPSADASTDSSDGGSSGASSGGGY